MVAWGSSGIFVPVEMALNRAWGGLPDRGFWRSRIRAFFVTLAGGLLALLSITLSIAARSYAREWPTLARFGVKLSALMLTYLLFLLVYRFVPGEAVGGRRALGAALVAGTAWELVKYLFVVRLGQANLHAFYGPVAFAVSLILWAYVSSLVLVFGALVLPVDAKRR